jgi:hypothetical protein
MQTKPLPAPAKPTGASKTNPRQQNLTRASKPHPRQQNQPV